MIVDIRTESAKCMLEALNFAYSFDRIGGQMYGEGFLKKCLLADFVEVDVDKNTIKPLTGDYKHNFSSVTALVHSLKLKSDRDGNLKTSEFDKISDAQAKKVRELEGANKKNKETIEKLRAQIKICESANKELSAQNKIYVAMDKEHSVKNKKHEQATKKNKKLTAELAELKKEREGLFTCNNEMQAQIDKLTLTSADYEYQKKRCGKLEKINEELRSENREYAEANECFANSETANNKEYTKVCSQLTAENKNLKSCVTNLRNDLREQCNLTDGYLTELNQLKGALALLIK